MKNISILGSTGSIGTQTLDIIDTSNYNVVGLSGNHNINLLEEQTRKFEPKMVCVYDEKHAKDFRTRVRDMKVEVVAGLDGLIKVATISETDIVLTAVVGMIGLVPTVEAIKNHKDIALANKETLVAGGHIIMKLARENNVNIIPVDSEHSAIFQSISNNPRNRIEKILLTASGGPFFNKTRSELENITLNDALKHPNWNMGAKVTIDSSTLANKGLEVIEAKWLFDVKPSDIEVVVQRESIIHSMVQFVDGNIIAQLGAPDMRIPISYALSYPDRQITNLPRLNFDELKSIHFDKPDIITFPMLSYAYDAINAGGSMPLIFNVSNEIAVNKFINGELKYLEISEFVKNEIDSHKLISNPTLDEILDLEKEMKDRY